LLGLLADEFFGIDTIIDCFGLRPLWRERLNRVVTDGAILLAVDLSMRAEILSGPEDLDVSRDVKA